MQNKRVSLFGIWVVLAAISTVLVGLVYATVQQNYRQNANDPQIEITQEISGAIAKGAPIDQIIPPGANSTDIKTSLSAFAMIFDKDGKVTGSSAKLNDKDPVPPKAVLESSKKKGRSLLTWEPEAGTRIAAVIVPVKSGDTDAYVLAGRNIREVEKRENQLALLCLLGWGVLLILSALLALSLSMFIRGNSETTTTEEVVIIEETTPTTDPIL